jgi:hypothetical protein
MGDRNLIGKYEVVSSKILILIKSSQNISLHWIFIDTSAFFINSVGSNKPKCFNNKN